MQTLFFLSLLHQTSEPQSDPSERHGRNRMFCWSSTRCPTPARRYSASQVSLSCTMCIYLVLAIQITKQCMLVAQWYNQLVGMHYYCSTSPGFYFQYYVQLNTLLFSVHFFCVFTFTYLGYIYPVKYGFDLYPNMGLICTWHVLSSHHVHGIYYIP